MARILQTILPIPLSKQDIASLAHGLPVPWRVEPKLERISAEFPASNVADILSKINIMAAVAQRNRHHPDFFLSPAKLNVSLFSHAFGGLSTVDFEMVKKINHALESWAPAAPKSSIEINHSLETATFNVFDFPSAVSILNQAAASANDSGKPYRLSLTSYRKLTFELPGAKEIEKHGKSVEAGRNVLALVRDGRYAQAADALQKSADADLNVADVWGYSPLFYAIRGGYQWSEPFIEKGADVNFRSPQGRTPLFWSVARGDSASVEMLLSSGADSNIANTVAGNTPLIYGAVYGHFKIVKMLISAGARKDHRNFSGFSAHDYATKLKRYNITRFLK